MKSWFQGCWCHRLFFFAKKEYFLPFATENQSKVIEGSCFGGVRIKEADWQVLGYNSSDSLRHREEWRGLRSHGVDSRGKTTGGSELSN